MKITDDQRLIRVVNRFSRELPIYDDGYGPLWIHRDSMGISGVVRAQSWEDAYSICEDEFTRAYIQTALWSSTEYRFGECPCCGREAILSKFPEPEFEEEALCDAPGCGVREIPNPEPMDQNYGPEDISPEALSKIVADCARFQSEQAEALTGAIATGEVVCGPDFGAMGRAGHDFWLTRNGHGAGFWDGDWPEPMAATLTAAVKSFCECDLYAGDDGRLYLA